MFNNNRIRELNSKIESINTVNNVSTEAQNNYLQKCRVTGYRLSPSENLFRYSFQSVLANNNDNIYGFVGDDAICINEIGQNPTDPSVEVGDIVFMQSNVNGYEFSVSGSSDVGKLDPLVDLIPKEKDKEWWISRDCLCLDTTLFLSYTDSSITVYDDESLIVKEFDKEIGKIVLTFANVTQEQQEDNKYKTSADFSGTFTPDTSIRDVTINDFQFSGKITITTLLSSGLVSITFADRLVSPSVSAEAGASVVCTYEDGNGLDIEEEHKDEAVKISTLMRVGFEDGELKFVMRDLYYDSKGLLVKVALPDSDVETALHIHSIPIIARPSGGS